MPPIGEGDVRPRREFTRRLRTPSCFGEASCTHTLASFHIQNWWYDLSLRAKGTIVLAGPVAATFLAATLFFLTKEKSDEAAERVKHTVEVQQKAGEMLGFLTESETGMRGYFLTHDRTFLETKTRPWRKPRLRGYCRL